VILVRDLGIVVSDCGQAGVPRSDTCRVVQTAAAACPVGGTTSLCSSQSYLLVDVNTDLVGTVFLLEINYIWENFRLNVVVTFFVY